ncbi:MAG: hypothetical protein LBS75_01240 [Synergistaceae bacterium]|jgi:response regulator RpfG family c-di-GMP phosphodiesterase|nr:hypothetical protein [Synergistaceae bacterium]
MLVLIEGLEDLGFYRKRMAFSSEEAARIILDGKGAHADPVPADVFGQAADQFAAVRN